MEKPVKDSEEKVTLIQHLVNSTPKIQVPFSLNLHNKTY